MRVLVVGHGGREHALVWKFSQSLKVKEIYAYPGNPGIFEIAKPVEGVSSLEELRDFAIKHKIDLTVVGPELYLAAGIADLFEASGLRVFGPKKEAAKLESSKSIAKDFMVRHNIPTATYFVAEDLSTASSYIKNSPHKLVIKADGLAQGKGVFVTDTQKEAIEAAGEMLGGAFGEASKKVVIEQRLEGPEISVFVLADKNNYVILPVAMDHKRAFDNDEGPNTGGMGAIAPIEIPKQLQDQIENKIIKPTIKGLIEDNISFSGVLFIGLILTEDGPSVLEYNVRLGDPETQAILPLIQNDLYVLINDLMDQKPTEVLLLDEVSCCVVLASKGYPNEFKKGVPIKLPLCQKNQLIFHSGTDIKDGQLINLGGRVLSLVGLGKDLSQAQENAYDLANKVEMENKYYRSDIGKKTLNIYD